VNSLSFEAALHKHVVLFAETYWLPCAWFFSYRSHLLAVGLGLNGISGASKCMVGCEVLIRDVKPGVKILKLVDRATRYFEALWEIPEGVSYNAYLVETSSGFVLIDGWKRGWGGLLLKKLEELGVLNRLTHVITNHLEPDHAGTLPELLKSNPRLKVLGHIMAKNMIRDFYGAEPDFKPVSDGEEVAIGGLKFKFVHTPWLHWPETIVTFVEDLRVGFTCDVFGSFGGFEQVFLSELSEGERAAYFKIAKKYFADVVGHYREFVLRSASKLKEVILKSDYIAPAHGLVLSRDEALKLLEMYEDWSSKREKRIVVIYGSMYRFTEKIAEDAAKSLAEAGFEVKTYKFTDTERSLVSEVVSDALGAEGLLVAAPVYENQLNPLVRWVLEITAHKTGCNKVLFINVYGWGAKSEEVKRFLSNLKCREFDVIELKPREAVEESAKLIEKIKSFFLK